MIEINEEVQREEEFIEIDLLCCFYDKVLNAYTSRYFSKQEIMDRINLALRRGWPVHISHGVQMNNTYKQMSTYNQAVLSKLTDSELESIFDENNVNPEGHGYVGNAQHIWWI